MTDPTTNNDPIRDALIANGGQVTETRPEDLERMAHEAANPEETAMMDPAVEHEWDQMMVGASTLFESFRKYCELAKVTPETAAEDFTTAFDEGGERRLSGGGMPIALQIAMLCKWFGISDARTCPNASRQAKELTIELAQTTSPDELQALYQVVVKATKIQ